MGPPLRWWWSPHCCWPHRGVLGTRTRPSSTTASSPAVPPLRSATPTSERWWGSDGRPAHAQCRGRCSGGPASVVPAAAALIDTAVFKRVFVRAVSDRHRALIDGDKTFSFELPLGEGLVFESLNRVAPRVARAIPPDLRVPVLRLDPLNFELRVARFLSDFAGWRWPLLLAVLLSAAGCALMAGASAPPCLPGVAGGRGPGRRGRRAGLASWWCRTRARHRSPRRERARCGEDAWGALSPTCAPPRWRRPRERWSRPWLEAKRGGRFVLVLVVDAPGSRSTRPTGATRPGHGSDRSGGRDHLQPALLGRIALITAGVVLSFCSGHPALRHPA